MLGVNLETLMSVESVNIKIEDDLETMSAVQSIKSAGIKQTMWWLTEAVGSFGWS